MLALFLALLSGGALFFPAVARAVCPLCTIAVGAGLGLSRWLGIDDSITGVWVGGLLLSSSFWLASWAGKKGWFWLAKTWVAIGLFYLLTIPPLFWTGMIGQPGNTLWGLDKLLLGIGTGSLLFVLAVRLDHWLRSLNQGKVFVYYQRVIIPVFLLTLLSAIFYLLTS